MVSLGIARRTFINRIVRRLRIMDEQKTDQEKKPEATTPSKDDGDKTQTDEAASIREETEKLREARKEYEKEKFELEKVKLEVAKQGKSNLTPEVSEEQKKEEEAKKQADEIVNAFK